MSEIEQANPLQGFRNISVEGYPLTFSVYGHAQYRTCRFCSAPALWVVRRTSNLTNQTYQDEMCELHARPWYQAIGDSRVRGRRRPIGMDDMDRLIAALEAVGVRGADKDCRDDAVRHLAIEFPNGERFAIGGLGWCSECRDHVTTHLSVTKVI